MNVSVLGFGGAEIGFESMPDADVSRLLNSALDAGLNVIDTGECYRDSEEKIGRAVGHRRGDYFLFTKCGHASGFEEPDWDPKMLAKQIDRSLQRLQTDHLDLLQLHSCSEEILRQGDVIDVLRTAKAAGKTRYLGYSGDRNDARLALETGVFDTLQTSINIADQQALRLTLPLAIDQGVGVIAKRPIANAAWRAEPPVGSYSRVYWERLQELAYPFLGQPSEEIVSIALRFTLAQPGVCTAIVGTGKPERWLQNARLLEAGALPAADVEAIRKRWAEVGADWEGKE
jgi:aryl-alcohol dehydrogenase-like predicted oxidoreductase